MSTITKAAAQHASRTYRSKRWDFVIISVAAILFALVAFGPSLFNHVGRSAPFTPLVIAHGILSFAWLMLFLVQTMLIATGRTAIHRRLGMASVILAILLVVVGYKTAIALTIRGFDLSGDLNVRADPLANLVFPLGDLVTFVALFIAGIWTRRHAGLHRRLMLLATVGMMTPGVARPSCRS